jgi:hypothetical protein
VITRDKQVGVTVFHATENTTENTESKCRHISALNSWLNSVNDTTLVKKLSDECFGTEDEVAKECTVYDRRGFPIVKKMSRIKTVIGSRTNIKTNV